MAIGTITSGTASFQLGSNPATSPGVPSGSTSTDLMLIHDVVVLQNGTANTPSTPSGWQVVDTFLASGSNTIRHTFFWRAGTPGSAPSISLSSSSTATQHRSRMYRIPGAKITGATADIFVIGARSGDSANNEIGPIAGLTTPEAGCALFIGGGRDNDIADGFNVSPPPGQTGITFTQLDTMGTLTSDNMVMLAASATAPNSGTVITAKTWTVSSSSSAAWIGQMLAIRPAASIPTVDAGADVTGHVANRVFTRTATENNNGNTITARTWKIQAGPAGVGTTIGTAAALSWTPTTGGTYTLRYTATNSAGSAFDDMTIEVIVPSPSGEYTMFGHYNFPASTNPGSFSLGTEFYVREPCDAVGIHWPRSTTSVNPTAARLEEIDGTVVPGTTVTPSGSGTTWQRTDFAAPVPLVPGKRYRSVVHYLNNYPVALSWPTRPLVVGPLVTPDDADTSLGFTTSYVGGTSIASPTTGIGSLYWSDVVVRVISGPTVGAGADTTISYGSTFTRTATENDHGNTITSRNWKIASGPAGVGTTIGTAAALNWSPPTGGTYVLHYTATNSLGSGIDSVTVTVTMTPPVVNAGADATIVVDEPYTRTATESGDPASSRRWGLITVPDGSSLAPSTATYRYFRFDPTAVRGGASEPNMQISEFELRYQSARVAGMTVTTEGTNSSPTGEEPAKAADNSTSTKWLNLGNSTSASLIYDFGTPISVDSYRIATANDLSVRDPVSWVISGSTDGTNWVTLDTRTDYPVPTTRLTYTPTIPLVAADTLLSTTTSVTWTPDVAGTYVLRYTATNIGGTGTDDVTFQVVQAPAPTVDAGADASIVNRSTLIRTASETGDFISAREWRIAAGPAGVNSVLSTSADLVWAPSVPGSYTLRYTATNPGGSDSDDISVTVAPLVKQIAGTSGATSSVPGRSLRRRILISESESGESAAVADTRRTLSYAETVVATSTLLAVLGRAQDLSGTSTAVSAVTLANLLKLRYISGSVSASGVAVGELDPPRMGVARASTSLTGKLRKVTYFSEELNGDVDIQGVALRVTRQGGSTSAVSDLPPVDIGRLKYMSGSTSHPTFAIGLYQRVVTGSYAASYIGHRLNPAHLKLLSRDSATLLVVSWAGERGRKVVITTAQALSSSPTQRSRGVVTLQGYVTSFTSAVGDIVDAPVLHPARAKATLEGNLVPIRIIDEILVAEAVTVATHGIIRVPELSTVLGVVDDDGIAFGLIELPEEPVPAPKVYTRTFTRLR